MNEEHYRRVRADPRVADAEGDWLLVLNSKRQPRGHLPLVVQPHGHYETVEEQAARVSRATWSVVHRELAGVPRRWPWRPGAERRGRGVAREFFMFERSGRETGWHWPYDRAVVVGELRP